MKKDDFVVLNGFVRRMAVGASALAFALVLGGRADAQQIGITINGNPVGVSPAPINQAGRVFVPLRGVFENLGASVVYDNGLINATGDGHDISLHIGSTQATVDGNPATIDVAPFIIGASTYVPLRFVSQALGATVDWDASNEVVAITMPYASAPAQEQPPSYAYYANEAPPALPEYDQPPVPAPNYIWQPGYWAFGPGGYYWVPGTWVPAPQPNLYWTPPFWAFVSGIFGFHPGYWGPQVGYYGGINYGGGYFGNGYGGGRWQDGAFRYNTAVTPVQNTTVINNVYVDRTVINNETVNHISYNGGPSGVSATPSPSERSYEKATHVPMTALQTQHQQVAEQDHALLARVNGGKPPIVVAPKAFTPEEKPADFTPITDEDKAAAARIAATPPPVRAAPRTIERPVSPAVIRSAPPAVHATVRPYVRPAAPAVVPHPTPIPVKPTYVRPATRTFATPPPAVHPAAPTYVHTAPPSYVRPAAPYRPAVRTYATPKPVVHRPATAHAPPPKPKPSP